MGNFHRIAAAAIVDSNPRAANSSARDGCSDEVEAEANSYFHQMFSGSFIKHQHLESDGNNNVSAAHHRGLRQATSGNGEAPASEIQDNISFIINNISSANIEAKAKEFTDILKEQYYPWFAQYMVMKRSWIKLIPRL